MKVEAVAQRFTKVRFFRSSVIFLWKTSRNEQVYYFNTHWAAKCAPS